MMVNDDYIWLLMIINDGYMMIMVINRQLKIYYSDMQFQLQDIIDIIISGWW
jgi:hypothetical protein